eukprot:8972-Pyramimonas_sp.AAC.2
MQASLTCRCKTTGQPTQGGDAWTREIASTERCLPSADCRPAGLIRIVGGHGKQHGRTAVLVLQKVPQMCAFYFLLVFN